MPGSIKEQRTMNYLTMNNKYVPDISVYSRPFAVKSFIWLNLVFFSVNLCQSAISADKKMQNEPNPVLSEVEWISQVAHLINEQRTMNICQTNPISAQINVNSVMTKYYINEQRTMNNKQFPNEPNLNPFSPATTWRGCLAPTPAMDVFYLTVEWAKVDYAQRTSSIKYPESRIEQKMSNEPNLRKTNPILPAILSIYAIAYTLVGKNLCNTILQLLVFYACFSKSISITLLSLRRYVSFSSFELLLFLCGLSELGGKSFLVAAMLLQVLCALGGYKQKMSNEPNLQGSKVTHFINEL